MLECEFSLHGVCANENRMSNNRKKSVGMVCACVCVGCVHKRQEHK